MSLFDDIDLGADDYSGEKKDSLSQFTSKPVQKKYQPFGGQMPQAPQPQYEPIDYGYEVQPAQRPSNVFDELDAYDGIKKAHGQFKQYATENERSAKHYEGLYDDFVKNEFQPFFNSVGGFGDFDNDDEMLSFIDQMKADEVKASQEEDGFFGGSSDRKIAAQENLKKFGAWDSTNGLRDKFLRLKAEKDRRRQTADAARNQEFQLFEQLTNIPIPARDAMDAQIKARSKAPLSKKKADEFMDQFSWEQPIVGLDGEAQNIEKTDPRKPVSPILSMEGTPSKSSQIQKQRLAAGVRGDKQGLLARRDLVKKERNLRDKGIFFSQNGLIDGRPIGLSRNDVDLLDIAEMKAAGMTSYRGKPLELAMEELGGEERLKAAKIMESVYGAKSNYEDAQLAFLKVAGSSKADKAREKMEAARDDMQKVISLAAENGLDNELFEQAESTSWLGGLGNAIQRGVLMSEMSDYTPDFLTNTLDADEMQKFIEIASEIEKLPTSSTMKRVRETKSDGFLDAMGNLLFDNPAAIPEMFVESLSSFLPATIKWLIPSAGAGAAVGAIGGPGGALAGAGVGAKASWGVASFVLEASGMALEGMQELGVDWKNPKVFAAAWSNESIRNKIQKKMVQKGVPIAAADMLTGFMAGKVMGVANHTGNAMFKGGKLLDKTAFNKAQGAVPRFTTFQKTRNAAAELGFDSTMGMSGEFLGQWAAKEPGEAWDWDAIAAEGLVGVGPGVISSALEMRGPRANYFANAPIEIGGEQTTETGTTGTVTRAGYSAPYQTFNDAESMGDYLSTLPNANPEAVEFTKDWIAKLYAKNPEAMANLKIAISPRTPDANMENRGTFEARDGQTLIYLNEKEFSADPMATFMHEAGHLARVITMDEKQLMDVWSTIGKDAQLDAYAQYFTKRVGISFKDLDEATQAKVESAFNKTDNAVLAEEWFSYQFGQYLLGENSQVENDIKAELKTYADQLGDAYTQYSGTDAKGKDLFKLMFDQLGLGPAPETTINQPAPQPGINSDPQAALNAMPGTPQEKSMIARALNAMAGEKLLTESPSAYSRLSRANMMAGQAEAPDDPEAIAEAAPVFDPEKSKTRERSLEKRVPGEKSLYDPGIFNRKTPSEKPSGIPKNPENAKGLSSKNKSERASADGRELPKSLGTPSKREAAAAKLRIEKAQEKEAKKKELAAKIEEKRKARRQEPESPKVSLSDNTKVVSKKVSYEQKEAGEPVKAQKEITATDKKERDSQENKKRAQGKTRDNIGIQAAAMKMVDKQMPDRRSKRDQELYRQIKKNEKLILNKESLDKRIKEVQAKLGDNASVAGIITELLGLKKLTNLAPLSLASAIRKMVDPDASTNKAPSNQDVEDMAYEVTERIKDIKEFLRTEIARIDREIASLTQKPEAEVDYSKLDLHNKKPEVSALYVEEYIQGRIKTGGSWVVIVHGKGKTNKNTVALHKQLKKMPEVDNFRLFAKGGATHVNLKVDNQQQKTEAKTQKPKVEGQRTQEQTGDKAYKLNHSLASINKDGKVTLDMKAIKEDWDAGFPYLLGKDGRKGSQQKKEVFYQIDIDAFKKALKTPERYAQFIKLHEEGHKSAGDHGKYPKDWMSPEAIRMERLANKYAFEKMGIDWRKLKVYMPKVEEELADLYQAKRRVQAAIEMIAPEEASIDWQDIPHALLRIAPGKWDRKSGRKVTRDSQPDWQPLTLGMMAKMKDFEPYVLQRFAGTGYKTYFDEKRTPQELLWDFATREFNPEFGPEVPSVPYYGVKSVYNPKTKKMEDVTRTKSEYIMILEAVKASAIFSKKSSIATKPSGVARLEENKSTGDMEESARGYPSGFMSEKGTTFAAIIAERIRAMNNKAVEEGSKTPELTRMPVYGNNPTMEDVIALRAASGRTLELLGDPSDSEAQFNQDLFDIARDTLIFEKSKEKMATPEQRKLLREKLRLLDTDSKGRPRIRELRKIKAKSEEAKQNELDKQFDYAEQEGDPFPTVSGGSSLLKSLIDIPSIKKREEFEKGFYDQILNSLTKADLGIRLRSGYDMEATAENEEAITEYLKANKTLDKESKGRIKYLLNEMMISASNLERLRSEEIDLSESLSFFQYNPQAFNVPERLDFLRKLFKNLEKFDYGKLEDYEYLEPWREGDKIDERKGKYAHGEFQASKIFAPVFNVVESFAEDKVRLPFENIPASRALLTGPQESMLDILTSQEITKLSKSELDKLRKEAADFAKSEVRFSENRPNADGKKGSTSMLAKEAKESEDKYIFETVKSRVFKKAQQEGKFNLTGYFNQNRTTLEKDEVVVDSPEVMENADPAASFRISPLDIVEHYLAGSNPVKQMEKLQMLPSSEVKDGFRYQRQGGLGEGLLVYVFPQFIEAVYKELDIRSSSLAKNEDSKFRWNFERGKLRVDGKLMEDFSMFSSERKNRLSPEQMAVLVEPIVQAVIDARGIDIQNGLGRSRKKDYKLYERDPQLGAETMSDQGEFRDDSGNAEAKQSVKSEAASTEVMDEAAQSNLVRKIEEDPKTLDRLDDATLAEILDIGNISKDVRDLLTEEYAKRENIKQLDEVFTPKDSNPKSLNSDAGRVLTSDVNPNLTKATLLSKIAGDRELKNEFKEWAATRKESYDKGSFRMNMIDRMSPVKLLSQSSLEVFEKLGLKKGSLLHNWLDVHGRSHQYFGKGGNGLEQSRLDYYDPLTEIMRKHNVTQEEAGKYLIARAAPSKNLQIEAKAEEVLSDMRKEDEQGKGKEYKKLYDFYYDKDGNFIRNSGVETKKALEVMADMESKPEFVEFLKEFLPVYYGMNKDGLDQLRNGELIRAAVEDPQVKGKMIDIDEKAAMVTAASRFDFNTGKADKYGNKYESKVKLEDNYAYSPLKGFEGETEQFFDQEEAWEEFGSKSTGAGKGFNQPKTSFILLPAFGRKNDGVKSYGPDPVTVVGNAINQHTAAMIRAKKNEVSRSFGNMYALLYSVLNPNKKINKDSSEFFDLSTLNRVPEFKETYDILKSIHEPGNEKLLEELTTEFNKVFDKPFEPSETKMAYELKEAESDIAGAKIGLVRRTLSSAFKNDQNVFVFRKAGQPQFIRFNDRTDEGLRMADAMNNLRYESLPPILGGFNVGTRLMAKMFTSANLAFILPNFFRDVLTARIHLSEDNKKVLIKDALNRKNLAGFMKSIYQTEADIKNGINPNRKEEISKILALRDPKKILESGNRQAMYQYYKENGGKVDMFRHPTLVEKIKDIQKSLNGKDGWTKASWKKFWDFVDTANTAVENSIRASTFWAAIKDGRGPDEAAVIARNVTVDFNQKGNLTQTFGSLYVFFGASMNSIDRFFTTFSRRSPKERAKLIAGIAGAAFIINILNRLMDDDEDEEMPDYDTISSYKRDTNAILPLPAGLPEFFNDEKDTGFFSLPLPLGYNLFWTMGQVMGDMFAKNVFGRGGAGLVEATTRFTDSALSAFNPVGGSSGLAVAITPTPLVPWIELYANKNFMGSPIRYADRPFEVPKPGHMQDPKGTPEHWNKLSKAINNFMGGSDDVKGSFAGMLGNNPLYYRSDEDITFDISGNQMRHLVMGYLGGPGQKADALFGSLFSAGSGKPSIENVNDVPIVNRFLRATTYGSATRGTFYEVRDAVKNAEKAVKSAKQINAKTYTAVLNDNRELLKLSSSISQLDKQKNKMRRLKKQIEGSKTLTEEQKTQRVDDLQKKELNLMVKVIKQAQSLGIS